MQFIYHTRIYLDWFLSENAFVILFLRQKIIAWKPDCH